MTAALVVLDSPIDHLIDRPHEDQAPDCYPHGRSLLILSKKMLAFQPKVERENTNAYDQTAQHEPNDGVVRFVGIALLLRVVASQPHGRDHQRNEN